MADQKTGNDNTIEVLYQKMGDRWFAFSLIDDEVFVGSISQKELEKGPNSTAASGAAQAAASPAVSNDRMMKVHRRVGNS